MKLKKITLGVLGVAVIAAPIATVVSCGSKEALVITVDFKKDGDQAAAKLQNDLQKYTKDIQDGKYSSVTYKVIAKDGTTKEFKFDENATSQTTQDMLAFVAKARV